MYELKDINRLLSEPSNEEKLRQQQMVEEVSKALAGHPEGLNATQIAEAITNDDSQEVLDAVWRLISQGQAYLNDDLNLVLGKSPYPDFD